MSKDLKKLFKKVEEHGWSVRRRRNGHYVLEGPDSKVFCSATASDRRALRNIERDLAKNGLDIRGE